LFSGARELVSVGAGVFLLIDKVLFYVGSHAFAGHAKNNFSPSFHYKRRWKLRAENSPTQVHQSSGEASRTVASLKIDPALEALKVPLDNRELETLGRYFAKREGRLKAPAENSTLQKKATARGVIIRACDKRNQACVSCIIGQGPPGSLQGGMHQNGSAKPINLA
jgi:hypothetical protein